MANQTKKTTSTLLELLQAGDVIELVMVRPFHISRGVKQMAEEYGAFWLIDAIASWQPDRRIKDDPMLQEIQFWTLTVNEDRSARLICERDTGDVAVSQDIPWTDFPMKKVKLYLENGLLCLPEER